MGYMVKPVSARDLERAASTRTLQDLSDELADVLRRSYITDDDGERTRLYASAALLIATARALFVNKNGNPDWAGRTYAYREWTREAYTQSLPKADRDRVRGAIAWHVTHTLHSALTPEELEDAGLLKTSPNERAQERREDDSKIMRLIMAGPRITEYDGVFLLLATVEQALRRVRVSPTASEDERTLIARAASDAIRELQRVQASVDAAYRLQ